MKRIFYFWYSFIYILIDKTVILFEMNFMYFYSRLKKTLKIFTPAAQDKGYTCKAADTFSCFSEIVRAAEAGRLRRGVGRKNRQKNAFIK